MTRLDFRLPEFTRFAWVSDQARAIWAPRIARIQTAWAEIEWRSVATGVRPCAHTIVDPGALPALTARMAEHGLEVRRFGEVGVSSTPYSSAAAPVIPGQRFAIRVAIGTPDANSAFCAAWEANDQAKIGEALGYPACCQRFFQRVWVEERCMDTTWAMTTSAATATQKEEFSKHVSGPQEANILLRWLGVRAVPHLPCRFDCADTVAFARKLITVGREAGFSIEMDWLLSMLSWPVEWSALHGIAEVRTPILKISTATDATAERYEVRRQGDGYPEEGARGLHFPYRPPEKLRVLSSVGFRRGLQNPLTAVSPSESNEDWFSRRAALFSQNGYRVPPRGIYQAILELVDRPGSILELGCGNGLLLRYLQDHSKHRLDCGGMDLNAAAIQTAQTLVFPERPQSFSVGDVRTYELQPGQHALILTNPLYADPGYYEQQGGQLLRIAGEGLITQYVERCLSGLAARGRLILFCYTEQLRQLAAFRQTFDRELEKFSPHTLLPSDADITFFLIDR